MMSTEVEHPSWPCGREGCGRCREATERLLDAVMNHTTPEEDIAALRGEWVELTESDGGVLSAQQRELFLLHSKVAYLSHMVADLVALVDTAGGNLDDTDITRESAGAFSALDIERGTYVYAIDWATHGERPTFDWYTEGRPA